VRNINAGANQEGAHHSVTFMRLIGVPGGRRALWRIMAAKVVMIRRRRAVRIRRGAADMGGPEKNCRRQRQCDGDAAGKFKQIVQLPPKRRK